MSISLYRCSAERRGWRPQLSISVRESGVGYYLDRSRHVSGLTRCDGCSIRSNWVWFKRSGALLQQYFKNSPPCHRLIPSCRKHSSSSAVIWGCDWRCIFCPSVLRRNDGGISTSHNCGARIGRNGEVARLRRWCEKRRASCCRNLRRYDSSIEPHVH